jgi:hypothetical protein
MTPEEKDLVADLFRRLAELERERRDPDAERLIRDGMTRAPNAVYALVQTTLLQDEALKNANDRIAELEDALEQAEDAAKGSRSFLGDRSTAKWNTGAVLRGTGSVPSVGRGDQPMGMPQGYERDRGDSYRDGPQGGGYGAPQGGGYGAPQGEPSRGGGFLGTAAAVAAGAIGSGLLMSGIRSALGGQGQGQGAGQGKGPFSGAFDHLTGNKSGADASPGGGSGDLARAAGLGDVGSSGGGATGGGGTAGGASHAAGLKDFDSNDSDLNDSNTEEEFSDDAFDDDDDET